MAIFGKKKDEDYEDDEEFDELEVKDLKPENRRRRKEIQKPWGKRERYTVLIFLLATVLISSVLAASGRDWKLPGLPQIKPPSFKGFNFDFLKGQTIIIGKKASQVDQVSQEKKEKILAAFREKTKNLSGVYALYIIDLNSGYSFGENEDKVLTAASLIKLPVVAAVFLEAEKGKINLDDKPRGSDLTFRQLAQEMGKKSNNQAQLTVADALGREKIQAVIDRLGMKKTSYLENKTTATNIGLFFQNLWRNEIVTEKSRDEILGYLTDTIYEDWIKKGIPEVRVAHKYGREVHVVNDAGIVYAEKPFVLVIMSQGVIEKEADIFISDFAAFVFREM